MALGFGGGLFGRCLLPGIDTLSYISHELGTFGLGVATTRDSYTWGSMDKSALGEPVMLLPGGNRNIEQLGH